MAHLSKLIRILKQAIVIIVKGDYISGNKIVNNVKQDNEYSAKKFKSIQNIVMVLIVLIIWIIGMAFAYFTGA